VRTTGTGKKAVKGISNKFNITLRKQNDDKMKTNDHWLDVLTRAWIEHDNPA